MLLSIRELLERGDRDLACVPFAEGRSGLLSREIETLRAFGGIALQVDVQAFPLNVYLMAGSSQRLAIYPQRGGTIKLGNTPRLEVSDGAGHELHIYRDPFTENE